MKLTRSLCSSLLLSICGISSAWAGPQDCALARVVSGKSCSKLRVEFNLEFCEEENRGRVIGQVVECRANMALAELRTDLATYRVKLVRSEGAWGGDSWQAYGKPKGLSQKAAAGKSPVSTALPPAPVLSGFIDAQAQISSTGARKNGFLVNDGALYISHLTERLEAKIDIPFRMAGLETANFELGATRAQAYVSWKWNNGLRVKLGQFDTTFGLEANDTVDVPFTRQGIVYNSTDPFVHTGMMLSYDWAKELSLNFYLADPNDRGVMIGKNPQFGAQILYASELRLTAGALLTDVGVGWAIYADTTAGVTLGKFTVDTEVNLNQSPTLTRSYGLLGQVMWSANEEFSYGTRVETVENLAPQFDDQLPSTRQTLLFVGPQWKIDQNLRLKLDYSYQIDQLADSGARKLGHGGQLAAVYRL